MRITADLPLVLGSASPRRRELVALLGVPFVVRSADVDETLRAGEAPDEYLARVVHTKLEAVRALPGPDAAGILAADTIVVANGDAVLGKPGDDAEARGMLSLLSAGTHEVKTGFVLAEPGGGAAAHLETVTTRVTFRALSPEEIAGYVASGEGRDKAGSYAVQGRGAAFVSRIDGSYTSVVGLPLCQVLVAIRALGWV